MYITGVLEREEEKWGRKKCWRDKDQNLVKDIDLQIQEAQREFPLGWIQKEPYPGTS